MRKERNFFLKGLMALLISGIFFLLPSCSTKKNTAANRQWQAFTTRYNIYFNGDEHFKETLSEMENNYEDDYTRQLLMHPVEAKAESSFPQPSGDFTRSIEKMQKAIELHSISRKPQRRTTSQKDREFRNREEFNPFLHNAWMLLGISQYFNGDFTGAAGTFQYVAKHFRWLPETVTEARLWEARAYCALGWRYDAENALYQVKEKDLTNDYLKWLFNFVEADFYIHTDQINEAIPYLRFTAEGASGMQKHRLWFLLGQLYSRLGDREKAYHAFRKAEAGPSTPYRHKFNSRIKQSEVYTGNNYNQEIKSLNALARYKANQEFLDQIYFAIGNIYIANKDTLKAVENYRKAINLSKRQGIDLALVQLALGNIYFSQRKYVEAQPFYAQAVPYLSASYPQYSLLRKRSDVLDELALYAGNVTLQDSLLTLADLSQEEQIKIAEKIIADLKRKEKAEKEEAARQEFLASQSQSSSDSPNIPGIHFNADDRWYFYNPTAKNSGKVEFQRKWGARKLEDDWRRKNKNSFSFEELQNPETDETIREETEFHSSSSFQNDEKNKKESDPHYVEFYLKQIPQTSEEKEEANDIIRESLYNSGLILKDRLEDYPAARIEFIHLNTRYPENIYKPKVYYNLFLMDARENNETGAEEWRRKLINEFPEHRYSEALKNPDYFNNLRKMHEVEEELYEEAYRAYLANENETVHRLSEEMESKYPMSKILPKFVFIDALSYFTEGNETLFKDKLTELLKRWPETDMTDMATAILRGISSGKKLYNDGTNTRGLIWTTRLSESDDEKEDNEKEIVFEKNPDSPQYFVLAFPKDIVNPNFVLFEIARFNFSTFLIRDFDLEQMSFSNMGLLVVKGFANLKELEQYRTKLESSKTDLPAEVIPISISKEDFELLLKEGKSFQEYFEEF